MRLVLVSDLYKEYHDRMRNSVYDDATFFEFLILETFQRDSAGLPSLTKRTSKAFDNFDYKK
jgi:DNA-3-methyladenine glycosylase I